MQRDTVTRGAIGALFLASAAVLPAEAATPEWDALVKAAQAEGQVEVILSGQTPRRLTSAMPAFEEEFGVKVNFQTGSGRAHAQRILAERELERYTLDVWLGGANTPLRALIPNNALADISEILVHPEVTDKSKWFQNKHHYTDNTGKYIFTWGASPSQNVVYNTDLVDPTTIQSYWDLLDPRFKGKIVSWSPAAQGTGASSVPLYMNEKIGPEWFKRWANDMDPTIVTDARQGAEWVAIGRFPIGMFGLSTQAEALKNQGFPIKDFLPQPLKEGEVLSSSAANLMLMDKAPNPNAAALFINWALTKEAQTLFITEAQSMDSLRRDVPDDVIEPQYRLNPDAEYIIPFSDPEYAVRQDEILEELQDIMAEAGYGS